MNLPMDHPALLALAWTLLHFLWQGALLGLAAKAGLWLLRRRSPQARYLFAAAAMVAMAAAPLATFAVLAPSADAAAPTRAIPALTLAAAGNAAQPLSWLRETGLALRPLLPWAVAAWMAGVAVLSLRLLGGWLWLVRLRARLAEPAGACWQLTVNTLARRMKLRCEVRIFRSFAVDTPMVIGWLKPLVLVPAAALTGLSPEALEAVLAHELAHVRRHDYLVNLAQSVLEVLLFYHPAVWWISAQVRQERELCCDDAAVALCGDPVLYARALAALEGLRGTALPATRLAPAAHGGSLMNRIQRLIAPTLPPSPSRRAGILAALAVTALGAGTVLRFEDTPPKVEARSEAKKTQMNLIVRGDEGRLTVRMQGDVKIRPDGKPGYLLGDGGVLEIRESAKDGVRRFKASREKGAEARSFSLDGQEKPVDEAWLNARLEKIQTSQAKAAEAQEKAKSAEGKAKDAAEKARRIEVRVHAHDKDGKEIITEDIKGLPEGGGHRVIIRKLDGDGKVTVEEHAGKDGKGVFVFKSKDGKVETLSGDGKGKVFVFEDGDAKRLKIDVERIARDAKARAHDLQWRLKDLHGLRDRITIPDLDFDFDFDFDHDPKVFRWEGKAPERAEKLREWELRGHQREMEALQREMERLQRRMERLQERMHREVPPPPPSAAPKAPKAPKAPAPAPRSSAAPTPAIPPAPPAPPPPPPAPKAPAGEI